MNKLYKAEFACTFNIKGKTDETVYILNVDADSLENAISVAKSNIIDFLQLKYSKFGYIDILKSETQILLSIQNKLQILLELTRMEQF